VGGSLLSILPGPAAAPAPRRGGPGGPPPQALRSTVATATSLFAVQQLCAVPAAVALVLASLVFAAVAPAEFQAPDIGGGLWFRLGSAMAPYLALLIATVLLGQLVGGTASRHVARHQLGIGPALVAALRDAVRLPGLAGVALVSVAAYVGYLALALLLLRVLWAPIAPSFAAGQVAHPATPLLLVGFMAIWLCLVLGAGALHAWSSAWWSAELAAGDRPARREEASSSAHLT
jgi:hypothetical protein